MSELSAGLPTLGAADVQTTETLDDALVGTLESTVLPAFLPQQRWFADKDTALEDVKFVDGVAVGAPAWAHLAIVEVARGKRMYFVPLTLTDERVRGVLAQINGEAHEAFLADGLATDTIPLAIVDDMRSQTRRSASRGGTFVAHAAPALSTIAPPVHPTVRRLSVEQSNTSVVVGGEVMFKAYRRVHRGPQPELETARFLDAVGYANTPALLGFVEYEHPDSEPVALCIAVRFVASDGDGWAVTLAHLAQAFPPDAEPAAHADQHADFVARMHTLGRRTAELHRAFATPIGDEAFEPEPTTAADLADWTTQAQGTAETALATLTAELDHLPQDVRADARALLDRRAEIFARLELDAGALPAVRKTRYHGDFHLGQVLVVGDDWMIVDFEGEPGREPAVRRRKSSPLRDVAGMLRSINYAAVSGIRGAAAESNRYRAERADAARDWEHACSAAFLTGYRAAIEGCASYPNDPAIAQRLLDLFVLEKAFYEMSYELANRPSWLGIPLAGIRAILDDREHARQ